MSSTKTFSEMLKCIKQYNKTARETKAKLLGFKTSADLILYLEGAIANGKGGTWYGSPDTTSKGSGKSTPKSSTKKTVKPVAKVTKKPASATTTGSTGSSKSSKIPTIHVVDVLDASGSMAGGKFAAALKGINSGIKQLMSDPAKVEYTYTLCDFSDDVIFKHIKTELRSAGIVKGVTRGSTALFDAIGMTIEKIRIGLGDIVKSGDKVLMNIYTDGQENSSRHFTSTAISGLIETLSKQGWTITFIGTSSDVKYASQILKIDKSNTLVYDGTAIGLEKSLVANNASRSVYSQKVSAGEDVSKGFYKDIK